MQLFGGGRQKWFASVLILHDCRKVELIARAGEASQSHTLEAMMGLQAPHLLAALSPGYLKCIG